MLLGFLLLAHVQRTLRQSHTGNTASYSMPPLAAVYAALAPSAMCHDLMPSLLTHSEAGQVFEM